MSRARKTKCSHRRLNRNSICKDCGVPVDLRAKRNKMGAVRTNGFDSRVESKRADELTLMQKAGLIRRLMLQVSFSLDLDGQHICTYRADFVYEELDKSIGGWSEVVEDKKGHKTEVYKIKKKLMLALRGIEIRET